MSRHRGARPAPRVAAPATATKTTDSFTNLAARLGIGADNLMSGGAFTQNPISRNRTNVENAYRGNWVVRQVVDAVADDMTRAGVEITSGLTPEQTDALHQTMVGLAVWQRLNDTLKWSRLYGGAIGVMLIDGQKLDTPLRPETVGKGAFRGLAAMDRWTLQPSSEVVTDYGPDLGQPKFYEVVATGAALPRGRVHHSRCIRLEGEDLPFWQKQTENGWGLSILEPLYDVLVAFNSATLGAGQLVFRAHLRTYSVEGLREIVATGGKAFEGLTKQLDMIRLYQSNEGLTLVDGKDKFETHTYSFAGLSDVLLQFAQQLSGAAKIPLIRLLGQAPAGLNATGNGEIRLYYDHIHSQQEARLRRPVMTLLDLACRSTLGIPLPPGFGFSFTPLWQMDEAEKATVAATLTTAILSAQEQSAIGRKTTLLELRQMARLTGVFSNISDEEIEAADQDPPPASEALEEPAPMAGEGGAMGGEGETVQDVTLNGSQVASMIEIVSQVAAGMLPRDTGALMLVTSFSISEQQADAILGSVGKSFVPKAEPNAGTPTNP